MDDGRVQTAERRAVRLVALQWRSSLRGCVRVVLEPQSRERFPAVQPRRCDGIDSDHTDGCWVRRCRYVNNNAGLCGPVEQRTDVLHERHPLGHELPDRQPHHLGSHQLTAECIALVCAECIALGGR
jgi:hypothetical protein